MKFRFINFEGWPGVDTALKCIEFEIRNIYPKAIIETFPLLNKGRLNPATIRVAEDPPDYMFIGGWDLNIKTIIKNTDHKRTKIFLLWCSPITQTELSGEMMGFCEVLGLLNVREIDYLSILLESDARVLKEYNKNVVYTPIFIKEDELKKVIGCTTEEMKDKINVDIFCAPCPRKNILGQLISLSSLDSSKVVVHTNYDVHNGTKPYFILSSSFFSGNMVNHSWMDRQRYLGLIKNMDFALQVTLSESFNYTAAEHMFYDVPVVLSSSSPISKRFKTELSDIIIKKHDDLLEISNVAKKLANEVNFRKDMGQISKDCILKINKENISILSETLMSICGEDS